MNSKRHQYKKRLFTRKESGPSPQLVMGATDNVQSKFIVQRVLELREEGIPLNDIAVLFRSSFLSFDLEIELNKAGIPYVKYGGFKFMETAHIKDIISHLKILENPKDIIAWNRTLLLVKGVGPRTAENIINSFLNKRTNGEGYILQKLRENEINHPDKLNGLFNTLQSLLKSKFSPSEMVGILINYYKPIFMEKYEDYRKREKDLEIFQNICERYRTLGTLLSDMAIEPPNESVSDITPVGNEDEYLILSTIHSAKGLEWKCVFIITCLEGRFPSFYAANSEEEMDEERRLM